MACVALVIDMREVDYKKPPGITHEQELELLANVYRLALESYREKRAAARGAGSGLDNAREIKNDYAAAKNHNG